MNGRQLEQIIEDAFQTVVGDQYPDFLNMLQEHGISGGVHSSMSTSNDDDDVQVQTEENHESQDHQDHQDQQDHQDTTVEYENVSTSVQTDMSGNAEYQETESTTRQSFSDIPIIQTMPAQPRIHSIDLMNSFLQSYQENFRIYQQNSSLVLRHLQHLSRQQQQQQHIIQPNSGTTTGSGTASTTRSTRVPTNTTSTTNATHRPTVANWFQPFVHDISTTMDFQGQNLPVSMSAFGGIIPTSGNFGFGGLGTGDIIQNLVSGVTSSVPTIRQFATATEPIHYVAGEHSTNTTCPITLEEFRDQEMVCRIKHCGHIFKVNALQHWFSRNSHCPVCRYDIRLWNTTEGSSSGNSYPVQQNVFSP